MRTIFYRLLQWTWGLPQTLGGLVICCLFYRCPHYTYHGAVVTEWTLPSGLSLGMFIFLPSGTQMSSTLHRQLLVHEYGHTLQSLILGPAYLLLIGIPSFLWANVSAFARHRKERQISYYAFYTEAWANAWGEKLTKEKSMGKMLID